MPRVGFEPTIPMFEPVKTVHALDRAGTVIDSYNNHWALKGQRRREWASSRSYRSFSYIDTVCRRVIYLCAQVFSG
jgi:hypothetical protein